MPSIRSIVTGLCALTPLVAAAPARIVARESAASSAASSAAPAATPAASAAAAPPAGGLSDVDILQLYVDPVNLPHMFALD